MIEVPVNDNDQRSDEGVELTLATNADMVWFGVIATATALGDLHSFRKEFSFGGAVPVDLTPSVV